MIPMHCENENPHYRHIVNVEPFIMCEGLPTAGIEPRQCGYFRQHDAHVVPSSESVTSEPTICQGLSEPIALLTALMGEFLHQAEAFEAAAVCWYEYAQHSEHAHDQMLHSRELARQHREYAEDLKVAIEGLQKTQNTV